MNPVESIKGKGDFPPISRKQLLDPTWRLNNLYRIINRAGKDEAFAPNAIQKHILSNMWYRNIVFKTRKRGTSTLVALLALDNALFEMNQNCQMINDTMVHAEELFRNVIVYAYEHLREDLRALFPLKNMTQRQMILGNGSVVQVGTSSVGTTPTFLHVSELAKIAHDTPDRAREILTGSIQAVASDANQMVWIESTAWGKVGLFRDMVTQAQKMRDSGRKLSKLDMKLLFYPWYLGEDNRLEDTGQVITADMEEYFAKLRVPLDDAQKRWYCKQYEQLGPDMFVQHPSNEDEPFMVSIEGAYFSKQFRRIYSERRICSVPVVPKLPVMTSWDLGMDDYMAIWFWQVVDGWVHAVDYYESNDAGWDHYVGILEQKGYMYGRHYAPHDINVKELTGKTRLEQAAEYGLRFKPVPRIPAKMDAITLARRMLDSVKFDDVRCAIGVAHLEAYRKKWNPKMNGWSDTPAKTGDQHAADAMMTFAQGYDGTFARANVSLSQDSESLWTNGKW